MVYSEVPDRGALDAVFGALADPTRRAIVARLALGETTVGEIARPLPMSLPAERACLVERRREGRVRRVRLIPAAMRDADAWLAPYRRLWAHHLDRLAAHLDDALGDAPLPPHTPESAPWPPPSLPSPSTPHASPRSASSARSAPRRSASSARGRRPKS